MEDLEFYKLTYEYFPTPIFIVERNAMKFVSVNRMASQYTGYSKTELLEMGPLDIDAENSSETLVGEYSKASADKTVLFEVKCKKKDGSILIAEMHLRALEANGKTFIVASKIDITKRKIIQEQLREKEEQLRLTVNNITDHAIYMIDPYGIIKTWNDGARNIKGYTSEEIIGKHISIFYQEEDVKNCLVDENLKTAREKGSIWAEGIRIRKDGSAFWAEVTLSAIYDRERKLKGFAKITRDITEQKNLKDKLSAFNKELKAQVELQTAQIREIFERITDAFIAVDKNLCYTYINKRVGEMFMVNPEESIGKPINFAFPDIADLPVYQKYLEALREQKYIFSEEYFAPFDLWFENHIYPSPDGLSIFFRDITSQKKAQQQLQESELKYRSLMEHASDCILISDESGNYLDVNSSTCQLLGYTREEMLEMNVSEIISDPLSGNTYGLLSDGKSSIKEIKLRRKDNSIVEVESRVSRLPDDRIMSIMRDTTERKKIEKRLTDSEASLKEAQELAQVGDWQLDYKDNSVGWSEEVYRLFEVPIGKIITYPLFLQLVHPDDLAKVDRALKEAVEDRSVFDIIYRSITGKGKIKYLHSRGKTFYSEEGIPVRTFGTVQDVTERIKAEEAITKSEAKFKRIFESNMVGFIFYDLNGDIVDANDRFLEIVGYTREDLLEGKLKWKEMTPPEFDYLDKRGIEELMATGVTQPFDKEYIRKDGTRAPITLGAASLDKRDYERGIAYILDVTQRKDAENEIKQSRAELRELAAHLQTIREEERASMAREIHDELGQQLTALKMDLFWLNSQDGISEEERKKKMRETIKLVDKTIKTVREISTKLRPSILDDLGLVEALEWHSEEFEKRSGIRLKFVAKLPDLNFDPGISIGLFRIYQESLTNVARHAEAREVTAELTIVNDQIVLKIVDDGKGFDKQKISRKKTLGLLGMKERVLMMGGEYKILSEIGKGTTVLVSVPLKEKRN